MSHRAFSENRIDRVFNTPEEAVAFYGFLLHKGYHKSDIDVLMSRDTWDTSFGMNGSISGTADNGSGRISRRNTEDTPTGALSAIQASIVNPDLNIAIAGPIAGTLAGVAASGRSLLDSLTTAGLAQTAAAEYRDALAMGRIIISAESKNHDPEIHEAPYGIEL